MAKKYSAIVILLFFSLLYSSFLNAQFKLYQRIFLTGTPSSLAPYLTPYTLDYNAAIGGSNGGACKPDTANIRQFATAGLSSPATPVNFDVELKSWPGYTTQAFTDSLNNYISIVQHFKAINNLSPVSFYAVPPQQIYNNYNLVNANFAPTAQAMLPLANVVDYYSPDFYNYGSNDTVSWRKAVDTTLAVIKKYYDTSKPIYPYISPSLDAFIDSTVWLYDLEHLYTRTKGALLWTKYSPNWDDNAPWWRCTKMFLVKKGLVPPLVIDSFNVSPIIITGPGLPIQWTTSSDTISKYFVLQRSSDSINFTSVSGQIYKLGYSFNLNQYRFTDTSVVPQTGKTIYYRLAITDINNNVSYSPLMYYTKSIYRSAGGNVSVDLTSASNWQEYDGTNWVAVSAAPSTNLGRGDTVIVRPGDTWNAGAYEALPSGAVLIDSGFTGSYSYSFTNSGTISFSGSAQQVIPGASILPYRTLNWGNFVINNASGVKCTEPSTDNVIHVNALSLNSGTFTVNADAGHAAGLYLDGPVSVGSGHIAITASGLNKGVIVNGTTAQTLPSGTFLNNTISTLQLSNPLGVTYGGPLTVSNKTELVRPASFTVNGNLSLDSLIIDTLKTTTTVSVSGTATLAGALAIKTFATTPSSGQQFTLISAGSISGSFASVTFPSGYSGTVSKIGNNLVLTMSSAHPISGAIYEIKTSINNTSNLDVKNGDTANYTKVQLYADNSTTSQQWKVVSVGGGYYKLISQKNTTKCLDVYAAGNTNGTQVDIYTDNGTNAQKWLITNVTGDYYTLSPACAPDKSLDDSAALTTNGNKIEIWSSNGANAQKWLFQLISPPAATDSISAAADAFVKSGTGNATTNYGYNSYLAAYNGYYNSYLKFNLKSVHGNVQFAQLRLYSLAGATTQWQVYKVNNNSWTESGITWNNQPNGDSLLATITAPSSAGFVYWDITPQLQHIASDSTLSLEVIASAYTYSSFGSRQGTASQQPMIVYSTDTTGSGSMRVITTALKPTDASKILGSSDESTLNIYPNPARTNSTVSCNEIIKSINVYNASGSLIKVVENVNSKQYNINLNDMPQGAYFIVINNNKSQQRKKLIKVN